MSDGGEMDMQRQVHPLMSANISDVFPSLGFLGNSKNKSSVNYKHNLNKFLKQEPNKDQISPRKKMDAELTKRLEILK